MASSPDSALGAATLLDLGAGTMLFTFNKDEKSCDEKELIWQEARPRLKVAAFASTRTGNRR